MKTFSWLVLRAVFGGYVLYAMYMNLSYWSWTVQHTAILTGEGPASLFAAGGLAIMAIGGLSILLGVYGRVGACLLLVFIAPGTVIHFRERDMTVGFRADVVKGLPVEETSPPVAALNELAGSAYAGHHSSGLKNLVLVAVCLLIAAHGTGAFSLLRDKRDASPETTPR